MNSTALETQAREKSQAAGTSVIAAIFLTSMKIVIGLMTGSLGILAEAAHSGLDLVAALITFFAVRVSDRPADAEHPYGHGKVENLSALAETILLLATCAWIIYEAIHRLFFAKVEVNPSVWAFLTMGISIVVDFSRSRVLARAAKKYHSQALEADALHFSTDIWSSAVVIAGLALVALGGRLGQRELFMRADAAAALIVAGIVIYVSFRLGRRTVDALLDTAPQGLAARITQVVAQLPDVHHVLQLRARGAGAHTFVEIRVAVPRHLSFAESHAVTHRIRNAVNELAPSADVSVMTVPIAAEEGVLEVIEAVAARGRHAVHNITTHLSERGLWIDLDLEVDPQLTFEAAHRLASDLEAELRTELDRPGDAGGRPVGPARVADINVHIEPRAAELVQGVELPPEEARTFIERIEAIHRRIPHARACQDIDVQRLAGRIYLAFHLLLDPELSIEEVHAAAEEMENQLRREFPQLGRVMIHTEPFVETQPGSV
jgi:cation diffusion facilitator family transporter